MTDLQTEKNDKKGTKFAAWLSLLGVLINAVIAIFVAISASNLEKIQIANSAAVDAIKISIEKQKNLNNYSLGLLNNSVSERKLTIEQLNFVKSLAPFSKLDDDKLSKSHFLLMELALESDEYERLIKTLRNSDEDNFKQQGIEAVAKFRKDKIRNEIDDLLGQLSSSNQNKYIEAKETLLNEYNNDPLLIEQIVQTIKNTSYSVKGRIRIFEVLQKIPTETWTIDLKSAVNDAIKGIKTLSKDFPKQNKIGSFTLTQIEDFETILNSIKPKR